MAGHQWREDDLKARRRRVRYRPCRLRRWCRWPASRA
jgi:hypothetical protein